jgi:hypothetical protein
MCFTPNLFLDKCEFDSQILSATFRQHCWTGKLLSITPRCADLMKPFVPSIPRTPLGTIGQRFQSLTLMVTTSVTIPSPPSSSRAQSPLIASNPVSSMNA